MELEVLCFCSVVLGIACGLIGGGRVRIGVCEDGLVGGVGHVVEPLWSRHDVELKE